MKIYFLVYGEIYDKSLFIKLFDFRNSISSFVKLNSFLFIFLLKVCVNDFSKSLFFLMKSSTLKNLNFLGFEAFIFKIY